MRIRRPGQFSTNLIELSVLALLFCSGARATDPCLGPFDLASEVNAAAGGATVTAELSRLDRARAEWDEITQIPNVIDRLKAQHQFFSRLAREDQTTLAQLTREKFNQMMAIQAKAKRQVVEEERALHQAEGSKIRQQVKDLKDRKVSFNDAIDAIARGRVEKVLTSHPTQVHSVTYRLTSQLDEALLSIQQAATSGDVRGALVQTRFARRLAESLRQRGIQVNMVELQSLDAPDTRAARILEWSSQCRAETTRLLKVTESGAARGQNVTEEAEENVLLYFSNILQGLLQARRELRTALYDHYRDQPGFDPLAVERAVDRFINLSTWAWDADGKSSVLPPNMRITDGIQQFGVYQKLGELLEDIQEDLRLSTADEIGGSTVHARIQAELHEIRLALAQHADAVRNHPTSRAIIADHSAQAANFLPREGESPSEEVRQFFNHWITSVLQSIPENATLESGHLLRDEVRELAGAVRSFYFSNQVRQNSTVFATARAALGRRKGRVRSQEVDNPVLRNELARLEVLGENPGPNGTVISAVTRNLQDINNVLDLLEATGLTGRVRYFPLFEDLMAFDRLESMMRLALAPGAKFRRHILARSALTGEPPTLTIMFALSDTNRMGSQGANHRMENEAIKLQVLVDEMFKQYPVTAEERQALAPTYGQIPRTRPLLSMFWGGGSQLARGGYWVGAEKPIYTVQGIGKETAFVPATMAFTTLDEQAAHGIGQAAKRGSTRTANPLQVQDALARLMQVTRTRMTLYQERLFRPKGYQNAYEAYIAWISMFQEVSNNNYTSRGASRETDGKSGSTSAPHRLASRMFEPNGRSFDQILDEMGGPDHLDQLLDLTLPELWRRLHPGRTYKPVPTSQRAITTHFTLRPTDFVQLGCGVEAELRNSIDTPTRARWLALPGAVFASYRRQVMAEVIAAESVDLSAHQARWPEPLRPLIEQNTYVNHFRTAKLGQGPRGKTPEQLTLRDLVSVGAYLHHTVIETRARNDQTSRDFDSLFPKIENPIHIATAYAHSPERLAARPMAEYALAFLGFTHQQVYFGSGNQAPQGLATLFNQLYQERPAGAEDPSNPLSLVSDPLGRLEAEIYAMMHNFNEPTRRTRHLNRPPKKKRGASQRRRSR